LGMAYMLMLLLLLLLLLLLVMGLLMLMRHAMLVRMELTCLDELI
jgi:hypothetical protein